MGPEAPIELCALQYAGTGIINNVPICTYFGNGVFCPVVSRDTMIGNQCPSSLEATYQLSRSYRYLEDAEHPLHLLAAHRASVAGLDPLGARHADAAVHGGTVQEAGHSGGAEADDAGVGVGGFGRGALRNDSRHHHRGRRGHGGGTAAVVAAAAGPAGRGGVAGGVGAEGGAAATGGAVPRRGDGSRR